MAVLTVPIIVRVDAQATGTGATPVGTPEGFANPPEIQDYPINITVRYESYAGGDTYPMAVTFALDEGDDLADALAAALVTARTAYAAAGHTFP